MRERAEREERIRAEEERKARGEKEDWEIEEDRDEAAKKWEREQWARMKRDEDALTGECAERALNSGFSWSEVQEMAEYGIKPYEEDAFVSGLACAIHAFVNTFRWQEQMLSIRSVLNNL